MQLGFQTRASKKVGGLRKLFLSFARHGERCSQWIDGCNDDQQMTMELSLIVNLALLI